MELAFLKERLQVKIEAAGLGKDIFGKFSGKDKYAFFPFLAAPVEEMKPKDGFSRTRRPGNQNTLSFRIPSLHQ